jgi:hypothetical protein
MVVRPEILNKIIHGTLPLILITLLGKFSIQDQILVTTSKFPKTKMESLVVEFNYKTSKTHKEVLSLVNHN